MILPVMWPDTSKCGLVDRVAAIFFSLDQDLMALAPKDRLGFVLENLSVTAAHQAFEQHQFSPVQKANIGYVNANQGSKKAVWQYDHIEKAGYMGIKLAPEHDLNEPMEQVDFLRTWGLSMWLTQRAATCNLGFYDLKYAPVRGPSRHPVRPTATSTSTSTTRRWIGRATPVCRRRRTSVCSVVRTTTRAMSTSTSTTRRWIGRAR
jgi:hypothetical protein